MLKLGAHLSISGGHFKALERVRDIGGNCLQIFSSSPRGWNTVGVPQENIDKFIQTKKELQIDPVYFHASYLINLADTGKTKDLSIKTLINEMNLGVKMGIKGSIVHLGSFKNHQDENNLDITKNEGYRQFIQNISYILEKTPKETLFIIENAGNRKIGQTLDQISNIVKDLKDSRIKVCLDTCHLHSAGYDLSTKESFKLFFEEFDQKIGLKNLELFHANDSKDLLGALRDKHENIGDGLIGKKTFANLLSDKLTSRFPFVIETPGFDEKGPDKKNLDILKSLAKPSSL